MGCHFCKRPVARLGALYCCDRHRIDAYHARGRALFDAWCALSLPADALAPEIAIPAAAPDGAAWYRLACPGHNGGLRYFPAAARLALCPFEPPHVPRPGIYRAIYYDVWEEVLSTADGMVIRIATPNVYISRGGTKP